MDDNDGNSQMRFQQQSSSGNGIPNCPSSATNTYPLPEVAAAGIPMMGSGSMFKPPLPHGGHCFYSCSSGLDSIGSLSLSEHLGASSSMATRSEFASANPSDSIELDGRGLNGSASHHLVHYPADPNLAHMFQKAPVLGGGSFSEMVNPFVMSGCARNSGPLCPSNPVYATERMAILAQDECQLSGEKAMATSPNGKRKRESDPPSPLNPAVNVGVDPQRAASGETSDLKGSNDKKQKMDVNTGVDRATKQTGKQCIENSPVGEAAKENYIHVRARRGQATNSHSLAERVRREKISERMKLLQELVPGCNKITGKAVMLDEIINYVQSLQQQVEFLSMKLATVNPELNFDIEQILSKDILHSRGGNTPVFGFNPGINSTHPLTLGLHQSLPSLPNTTPLYHSMPQAMWDNELQSFLPMDFSANPAVGDLGPNGSSKAELQR